MPRISGLQDSRMENWKSALRFGTWNIRTLFKPGAFRTLVDEVEKYRLGIVALQELRWSDTGLMQLKNTTLFYGACDNRRLGGSGFAVNKAYLNSVKDFKVISPRITVLTIAARWFNIAFVNVHAPTEEKEEVEKDEFYSLLNNVLNDIPANCIQITLGDFNAKIGKENYFRPIIGIHSLHEVSNDNGCRLVALATERDLRITIIRYNRITS